jgi:hypothetical protein
LLSSESKAKDKRLNVKKQRRKEVPKIVSRHFPPFLSSNRGGKSFFPFPAVFRAYFSAGFLIFPPFRAEAMAGFRRLVPLCANLTPTPLQTVQGRTAPLRWHFGTPEAKASGYISEKSLLM